MECSLCPNDCKVDRVTTLGKCVAPSEMVINRIAKHMYEEPPISGVNGSGTVFFGGCTMKCKFCQNIEISKIAKGRIYSPEEVAGKIKDLEDSGVHNINFVSPTHYSHKIRETLDIYRPKTVVYNTSSYEKVSELKKLEKYVDIYLPDFKYSINELGLKFSERDKYPEIAIAAIREMLKQQPENIYNDEGIMTKGVIIRHLVIPGYLDNSLQVLDLIKNNFGTNVTLSIMNQFTPMKQCPELSKKLKPIEYKYVLSCAEKMGFSDIFMQAPGTANIEYIPKWYFD